MPLAYWGNNSGDWSSTFAQLADAALADTQRMAERLDARRESELAARDEEMFARYQAGQVSNEEWLAYIERRRQQTSYDPQQQAAWTKAQLEWTERIADDKAASAFERSGNYGDYIGYLEDKLSRTKDSDGRLTLTKQIRDLKDALANRDFTRGAQRIVNDIKLGKATNADLLRFYRETRKNLRSNSPLFETVQNGIAEIQANITTERFETNLANINLLMSSGRITPKEAGIRQQALLNGSNLLMTDPTRFYSLMDASTKLMHSADPARLAQLEHGLLSGSITPSEYETQINLIADQLMDYDPETAFKLRSGAVSAVKQIEGSRTPQESTPIARVGPGGVDFQWISQMDGSQFEASNCTMASGAMLAYAMGYKNLSGGDLRYLTGDTVEGTNISQLYNALNRAGVDTSGMDLNFSGTFEQFKKQVGNGRSSVIVGDNAQIGAGAKASASMNGMHAWLVADYDPKKDAFLIYNSAMSRGDRRAKNGYWVSSETMRSFGFSGRASGSWLASPRGTAGKQHKAWHVIDVDTPPKREGTPKSYVGRTNPGISGSQRGATRATGTERPVTASDYEMLADRNDEMIEQTHLILDKYARDPANATWDGVPITPEVADEVAQDLVDQYDESISFAAQNGDFTREGKLADGRLKFVTTARQINGARSAELFNTMMRDSAALIQLSQFQNDPTARDAVMAAINARVQAFAAAQGGTLTDQNVLNDNDDQTQAAIDLFAGMSAAAADPNLTLDQKRQLIEEGVSKLKDSKTGITAELPPAFSDPSTTSRKSGDGAGQVISNLAGASEDKRSLEAGETVWMSIPQFDPTTRTWVPTWQAVPVTGRTQTRKNPQTGAIEEVLDENGQPVPIPDLSGFPQVNQDPNSIGWAWVNGKGGPKPVMVATYQDKGFDTLVAQTTVPGKFNKGDVLTQQQIEGLASPTAIQNYIDNGMLVVSNRPVTKMVTPGNLTKDGYVQPVTYVKDTGMGGVDSGSGQWYPERLPIEDIGDDGYVGVNAAGGIEAPPPPVNGYDVPLGGGVDPNKVIPMWQDPRYDYTKNQDPARQLRDPNDPPDSVYHSDLRKAIAFTTGATWLAWLDSRKRQAEQVAEKARMATEAANRAARHDEMETEFENPFGMKGRNTGAPFGPQRPDQRQPDILKQLSDRFGVKQSQPAPQPTPSRGNIPRPVPDRAPGPPPRNPVLDRKSLADSLKPKPRKSFFPPSPAPYAAAKSAQANAALAAAQAAAARANASVGAGRFGPRSG